MVTFLLSFWKVDICIVKFAAVDRVAMCIQTCKGCSDNDKTKMVSRRRAALKSHSIGFYEFSVPWCATLLVRATPERSTTCILRITKTLECWRDWFYHFQLFCHWPCYKLNLKKKGSFSIQCQRWCIAKPLLEKLRQEIGAITTVDSEESNDDVEDKFLACCYMIVEYWKI